MTIRLMACTLLGLFLTGTANADLFLVKTGDGPGFKSPEQAASVLENGIIPLFDALQKLEDDKVIVVGGLPAGSRTLYLVVQADSNEEVDKMLRALPAWGIFKWKVTPLQSLKGRGDMERANLKAMRSGM